MESNSFNSATPESWDKTQLKMCFYSCWMHRIDYIFRSFMMMSLLDDRFSLLVENTSLEVSYLYLVMHLDTSSVIVAGDIRGFGSFNFRPPNPGVPTGTDQFLACVINPLFVPPDPQPSWGFLFSLWKLCWWLFFCMPLWCPGGCGACTVIFLQSPSSQRNGHALFFACQPLLRHSSTNTLYLDLGIWMFLDVRPSWYFPVYQPHHCQIDASHSLCWLEAT